MADRDDVLEMQRQILAQQTRTAEALERIAAALEGGAGEREEKPSRRSRRGRGGRGESGGRGSSRRRSRDDGPSTDLGFSEFPPGSGEYGVRIPDSLEFDLDGNELDVGSPVEVTKANGDVVTVYLEEREPEGDSTKFGRFWYTGWKRP